MQAMDVATDKQLNRMIARNEEEFKLYQEIDKIKEAEEQEKWAKLGKPRPPR
jgi:hypothetical protein